MFVVEMHKRNECSLSLFKDFSVNCGRKKKKLPGSMAITKSCGNTYEQLHVSYTSDLFDKRYRKSLVSVHLTSP